MACGHFGVILPWNNCNCWLTLRGAQSSELQWNEENDPGRALANHCCRKKETIETGIRAYKRRRIAGPTCEPKQQKEAIQFDALLTVLPRCILSYFIFVFLPTLISFLNLMFCWHYEVFACHLTRFQTCFDTLGRTGHKTDFGAEKSSRSHCHPGKRNFEKSF